MREIRMLGLIYAALQFPLTADAQDFVRANAATVRLAPAMFAELPRGVLRDLERRGCRVPQVPEGLGVRERHNVIHGAFTAKGRKDWAVLCSVRDTSQILIYRDDGSTASDSLASLPDLTFQQVIGAGKIGFSRMLSIGTPENIRRYARDLGGPPPPTVLDHDGVEDNFVEKASTIYYFFGGKWLRLQGAD